MKATISSLFCWETRKSWHTRCAFEWMPERRLQHYLSDKVRKGSGKVNVFTIGTEGYGQDQQLLVLQEFYRSHRADMVVLWQTPDNDVWNNMFPTHWPANGWPKPTFRLINNELNGPTENMGDPVKPTNFKLLALLDRVVPIFDRDGDWEKHLPSRTHRSRIIKGQSALTGNAGMTMTSAICETKTCKQRRLI